MRALGLIGGYGGSVQAHVVNELWELVCVRNDVTCAMTRDVTGGVTRYRTGCCDAPVCHRHDCGRAAMVTTFIDTVQKTTTFFIILFHWGEGSYVLQMLLLCRQAAVPVHFVQLQ